MPTISPVQTAEVQAAISRAADRTGVDFDYLLAQAKLESNLDPGAKAKTSTATGLYQFIESTWLRTLDQHGIKHGFDWADAAIDANGRVVDAAQREQLLSLRLDPDTSSLMAAELAQDNAEGLRSTLGRDPEPVELYLAHFLGLGGAKKFLGTLESNPERSAASLLPQAAGANRSIFYSKAGPRSVSEVMDLMRGKVDAAYGSPSQPLGEKPLEQQFAAVAAQTSARPSQRAPSPQMRSNFTAPSFESMRGSHSSMADTLRSTFGDSNIAHNRANDHIAAAYGKFKALGL